MRASQLFIPTLREDPGDAEAVSHRLLVRGGFIRQVSAGLWTFLPLGWRVQQVLGDRVGLERLVDEPHALLELLVVRAALAGRSWEAIYVDDDSPD